MAPLMGDLAYALKDGAGQDQESADVTCQLLTFLCSNCLHRTAALLLLPPSCCNSPDAAVILSYSSGGTFVLLTTHSVLAGTAARRYPTALR